MIFQRKNLHCKNMNIKYSQYDVLGTRPKI
jgi:hypothetical protein